MVSSGRSKRRLLAGLLAATAFLAREPVASAAETLPASEPSAFSLRYSAPAACPTRAHFVEQIRSRVPSAIEGEGGPSFAVELRDEGAFVRGRLLVVLEDGAASEREVPAAPCADVARSLAIIVAIVLSGELFADPGPGEAPGPEAAASALSPLVRLEGEVKENRAAPSPPRSPEAERSAAAEAGRFRFGAFAHGTLNLAAAPFPALGVSAGVDLAYERTQLVSPSFRAGAEYIVGREQQALGDADFALVAALLRFCPFRYARSSRFELHACAAFDAGRLSVNGEIEGGREADMTWLAPGGALRLAGALSRAFAVELELAAFGLVHHDRFVFQPGELEVYDIPAFSCSISFGIAGRAP